MLMRISGAALLFSLAFGGCATQHPAPLTKAPIDVPLPRRTPYAPRTVAAAEYLRGYYDGYQVGYGGSMVLRSYQQGYELTSERHGWRAGNYDGCLAYMQLDIDALAAEGPPRISMDDTSALCARIERQTKPQTVVSPNKQFRAVYRQTHPGVYGRNSGRVTIQDRSGRVLASRDLTENGGRLVAVARWSTDSGFCVFTTISAGRHSWHFDPYIFSVADSSFRIPYSPYAVINPEFRFASPAIVTFTTSHHPTPIDLHRWRKRYEAE
jgi:hypothetical protein